MQEVGGVIGASVSGSFLMIIGLFNFFVLIQLLKVFRKLRSGEESADSLEKLLNALAA